MEINFTREFMAHPTETRSWLGINLIRNQSVVVSLSDSLMLFPLFLPQIIKIGFRFKRFSLIEKPGRVKMCAPVCADTETGDDDYQGHEFTPDPAFLSCLKLLVS